VRYGALNEIDVYSDGERTQSFELAVSLPSVSVTRLPISLQLSLPTDSNVESQLTLVYSVQNNSDILHDVDITVESSEAFMFAGHRQVSNSASALLKS